MKKTIKKITIAFLTATSLLSIPLSVSASTWDSTFSDKPVGFTFDQAYTSPKRVKDNTSSVYMKSNVQIALDVRTLGSNVSTGSNGINYTKNGKAYITQGSWFIYNSIKENGCGYANIKVTTYYQNTSGIVSGAWSPDSVGTYTVANP